jgi:DNA-binding winged helix-turn-helix (wHTH) protein/TolB-like protein/Tfp pilus assembly protein PilF
MGSGSLASGDFRVGDWLVQPSLTRIQRGTETVHVTPRAMQVLVQLAEAAGAVVSRNALLDAVWPRMAVTQDALSQCIVELRKAFGDDSRNPKIIETIPKVGVRLLAQVSSSATPGSAGTPDAPTESAGQPPATEAEVALTPRPAGRKAARHRWIWTSATTAVVLGIMLGALSLRSVERSIAVLPFAYDGAVDADTRLFGEGLHDELLSRLGKITALEKVMSRSAVMGYRDTDKSTREIGRELDVATLLVGRVHVAGDAVRLSVELIEAEDSRMLWSEVYPTALTPENSFAIQREIALSIADALDAAPSPGELARLRDVPTRNTQAYGHYLRGNDYFARVYQREEMLTWATEQYEKATDADPAFAEAWARLSITHLGLHFRGIDRTPTRLERAKAAYERAFEIDADLPEAYLARANYLSRGEGKYQEALDEFAIAARLIPQEPDLYFLRSSVHRRLGDWESAIGDLDRALDIDPWNPRYLRQQHVNYLFQRDYNRAEQYLDGIREIAPDDGTAHVDKVGLALYRDGRTELANQYESTVPPGYADGLTATYIRWLAALFDRNYVRALSILDSSTESLVEDGDIRESKIPKALLYAQTYLLYGKKKEAADEFASAKAEIERHLAEVIETDPLEAARTYVALAEVQAGMGHAGEAENSLARTGVVADPVAGAGIRIAVITRVLLPLGYYEQALEQLEIYLKEPGNWSIEGLARDPRFDPIRDDPRFAALVATYGRE